MRMNGTWCLSPVIAAVALALASASAQAKPSVSLSLPSQVDAGRAFDGSYSVRNVPPGTAVLLQRQVGTGRVWRTVARLRAKPTGVAHSGALAMGQFRFRITVPRSGRPTLTTRPKIVRAFANIPLGQILEDVDAGSAVVGPRTFNYVTHSSFNGGRQMHSDATTCRSVHFDLAAKAFSGVNWFWVEKLSQESRDQVTQNVGPDEIVALDALVILGQSWSLDTSITSDGSPYSTQLFINGSASCYESSTIVNDI